MAKWADYLISAVRYNRTGNRKYITQVTVHQDSDTSVGAGAVWARESVIQYLDNGYKFKTVTKNSAGQWNMGEDVRKVEINGRYYIRTDANRWEEDNLENLPEF